MKIKNVILNTLLLVCLISFTSCSKDDVTSDESQSQDQTQELKEVVGEWQMYRDENLESIIDQWTGTGWTTVDQWFQNTREDSEIILEFREDGTFIDRYADVETANGVWGSMEDGRYYFDYTQDDSNSNDALTQRRFVTIYCDNTYSVEIAGNDRTILYYKKIGTTECSELLDYNVE